MSKYCINKENAVLVTIDVQERLMNAMPDRDKVYKNIQILIDAAKQLGIPVIVTEQYPRGLGATVAPIKEHLEDYQYVEKVSFSAGEALLSMLSDEHKTFIITGTETHVCVFQTVRDLVEAGYNVHLVKDAICSRFEINNQSGLDLMRDLIHIS